MQAREIMTSEPRCITADGTLSEAATMMRDLDVGIVPVVDSPDSLRLKGVITDRDIAVRHVAERHTDDCSVSDHMSENITKATPEDDVAEIMKRMRQDRVRRIPVVEDGDRLVGLIAQADIAVKLGSGETETVEKTVEEISEPAEPQG